MVGGRKWTESMVGGRKFSTEWTESMVGGRKFNSSYKISFLLYKYVYKENN
jgi:hypothetical protein